MRVRFRISNIIEYLVIVFMILDFYTPYACALNTDYRLSEITAILIAILFLADLSLYGIKRSVLNRWALYFIPFYLLGVLEFINSVGKDQIITFVAKIIIAFPMLVFLFMTYAERGEMCRLLEKYVNVVTVIAGISLFFWIFGSQMGIIQPTSHIEAFWGVKYDYPMWFGVYTQRQKEKFLNGFLVRNQGIFCEGPMHNFVLIVALAYEMFIKNHAGDRSGLMKHKLRRTRPVTFRMVLLIATILSTITTTGMILLVMMFVLRYMLTSVRDRTMKVLKPFMAVIVGIAGLYLAVQIFLQKSTSGSWRIRFDDLRAGFLAFLSSPLFGTGFASFNGIDMFRSAWRTAGGKTAGFSNSIMQILGQGGLVLGLIYLVPIIGTLWKSVRRKRYDIAAFTALITVVFSFTVVSYTFVMLMLVAFFNAYILEPKTRTESVSARGKGANAGDISAQIKEIRGMGDSSLKDGIHITQQQKVGWMK